MTSNPTNNEPDLPPSAGSGMSPLEEPTMGGLQAWRDIKGEIRMAAYTGWPQTCGSHGHVWSFTGKGLKDGDSFSTRDWPCNCGEIKPVRADPASPDTP